MKVLHVTATFPPKSFGGVTTATLNMTRILSKRGYEVTVFTTDLRTKSPSPAQREQTSGVNVYYFKNLSARLAKRRVFTPLMMVPALRKRLRAFDVVHLHDYRSLPSIAVHRYAKQSAVPYLLQAHGSMTTPFLKAGLRPIFDAIYGPTLISDAARLVAVAPTEVSQYRVLGARPEQIAVVPNGIDASLYESLPERGFARRKLQVPDKTRIVLYLGRIHKTKRVDLLLDAFQGVVRQLQNTMLVLVGPDDGDLSAVLKHAREVGVSDKIRYVGAVSEAEKLTYYVDADVVVLPSPYEVFGIVVLEALMCCAPTIVTEGCGIAGMIRDNDFGYIAKAGDAPSLRDQILSAFSDEAQAREKALRARIFIKRNLAWPRIVDEIEKLYAECLSAR